MSLRLSDSGMLTIGDSAPAFDLPGVNGERCAFAPGKPSLLIFFQTDCPTCLLTIPYVNSLARAVGTPSARIIGISQDSESATKALAVDLPIDFSVAVDHALDVSRRYQPLAVPSMFLIDSAGLIADIAVGFDKAELNRVAAALCQLSAAPVVAPAGAFDGAPNSKPGCTSRHLEPANSGPPPALSEETSIAERYTRAAARASRIEIPDDVDLCEYCFDRFGDALPVIPPTLERVERMLEAAGAPPETVVGRVPPNYGAATVEKIAANAVMAGCRPEMMRVLIPLVRAACDERFNMHGVQATTHFAAPLVILNGPVRRELQFACGSNVFSNVTRANSTLGRAIQLILINLGGARPGEIDMSTLGNAGKFSYCIAENEEESPWDPLHVEAGFNPDESTVTLFAAESPRGVSEHNARHGATVLTAVSHALATVWTYRVCAGQEAIVVLCPEHVRTLERDGFTKQRVREFLFENTGVPVDLFEHERADGGEGTQYISFYSETTIGGRRCYRKFHAPEAIKLIVAGGTAGKFSAVIGGWATGPRGSQMVTYKI